MLGMMMMLAGEVVGANGQRIETDSQPVAVARAVCLPLRYTDGGQRRAGP